MFAEIFQILGDVACSSVQFPHIHEDEQDLHTITVDMCKKQDSSITCTCKAYTVHMLTVCRIWWLPPYNWFFLRMTRAFTAYADLLQDTCSVQFCKEISEAFNETSYSSTLECKFKAGIAEADEQHKWNIFWAWVLN